MRTMLLLLFALLFLAGCTNIVTPRPEPTTPKPELSPDRPAFSKLPPDLQDLVTRWMRQDCAVDNKKLITEMTSAGPVLQAALWEAYDRGPTLKEREALLTSLGDVWTMRRRWLETHGKGIDPERTKALLTESEEQFRIDEEVKQVNRWRDAGINGLGLVCNQDSLTRLRTIAKDPKNESSTAAHAALTTSKDCMPRQDNSKR